MSLNGVSFPTSLRLQKDGKRHVNQIVLTEYHFQHHLDIRYSGQDVRVSNGLNGVSFPTSLRQEGLEKVK